MKKCSKCKEIKPFYQFSKQSCSGSGYGSKCKLCCSKYMKIYFTESVSNKSRTPSQKRFLEKYPEKRKAKNAIYNIKKVKGYNWHHWSYNEMHYIDVISIEKINHYKLHRYIKYDIDSFMYVVSKPLGRFLIGDILDTKEIHLEFYKLTLMEDY